MAIKLKFKATKSLQVYHGFETEEGRVRVHAWDGDEVVVSEEKSKQLLTDFPQNFAAVPAAVEKEAEAVEAQKKKPAKKKGA